MSNFSEVIGIIDNKILQALYEERMYDLDVNEGGAPLGWEKHKLCPSIEGLTYFSSTIVRKHTVGVNLTPHAIRLNDGREYLPTGTLARVSVGYGDIVGDVAEQQFGEVIDLPEPRKGFVYIVSALVLAALKGSRDDVVAPATGHPDVVRNEAGHIISVPCFTR